MILDTNLIGHVKIHLQTGNNTIKTAIYSILVWTKTSAAVSLIYLEHRLYKQRKHLKLYLIVQRLSKRNKKVVYTVKHYYLYDWRFHHHRILENLLDPILNVISKRKGNYKGHTNMMRRTFTVLLKLLTPLCIQFCLTGKILRINNWTLNDKHLTSYK